MKKILMQCKKIINQPCTCTISGFIGDIHLASDSIVLIEAYVCPSCYLLICIGKSIVNINIQYELQLPPLKLSPVY